MLRKKKKTDIELIEQFLGKKDTKAFGKLYDRYSNKVYGRCLSFFQNEAMAKDATHDIFIKVLYQLNSIKDVKYFSTWLYSVTYRHCVDQYRAKKKQFFEDEEGYAEVVYEEDDTFFDDFYSEILDQGLSQLTDEERAILMMKYYDELGVNTISEILSLKESAVKMRLKRSRDKLKSICLDILQKTRNDEQGI